MEAVVISAGQNSKYVQPPVDLVIDVFGCSVTPKPFIRDTTFVFDDTISMAAHIRRVCPGCMLSHSRHRNYQEMPFHHGLQNNNSCFSHVALGLRQRYALRTVRDADELTADGSKFRGTADYWNPQTSSHNISFILFTLVACSSANRIQASFTCISPCASPLPRVYVVASDSIHTHPNTEIRRSTSVAYTAVSSRAILSSGLFYGRTGTVERPASRN